MREERAFFEAISTLMGTLRPNQVKTKVALLCHTHQVLRPRYSLKIQVGPKWAERTKLSQDVPQGFRGDKTVEERSQDHPAVDCCVHQGTKHNNQSRKGVARQGNLCRNFEIGKVPLSRPSPPTMPSKAKTTTKEDVLVARRDLGEDDPRKGHLWGLNPNIWVRLSKPEREAWDALNVSARASRPERDRVPAFLKGRGAPMSRTTPTSSSTKAYASRGDTTATTTSGASARPSSFTLGLPLRRLFSARTARRRVLPFDSTVDGGVSYVTYVW